MATPMHKGDYRKLPDEDRVLGALRGLVPPGQFMFPCPSSMQEMATPTMQAKYTAGPVGTLIVRRNGAPQIGPALAQWFLSCLVIGTLVAYLAGQVLPPGASSHAVFRLTTTAALLGHGFSSVTDSIWKGITWSTTWRFVVDGVLYALATGAAFAWLWPAAA